MAQKTSFPSMTSISIMIIFSCMIRQITTVNLCKSLDYQQTTLKLVKEQSISDSFYDLTEYNEIENVPNRFEASDVVLSRDGYVMYVVFDNSYRIGAICTALGRLHNCTDRLLDWPDSSLNRKKSGFEGMAYNSMSGTYFVVQEAVVTDVKKVFQANVFEIQIAKQDPTPIRVIESCLANWDFSSDNKGFEGLEFVFHQGSGQTYLLGLCEANKCDPKSNSVNDGRIVVLQKKKATNKNACSWVPVGTFDLPSSVSFEDYSAISIYHRESRVLPTYVAVTSQENSQLWIGLLEEIDVAPFFKLSSLAKNTIYNLPRITQVPAECSIQYCNIEGVAWRGKNQLILVSDKAKDDQNINCIEKDQSVHYLALPEHLAD